MNRETEASAWEKIGMQQLRKPRKERRRGAERGLRGSKFPNPYTEQAATTRTFKPHTDPALSFAKGTNSR
jgi:hypothetical protein